MMVTRHFLRASMVGLSLLFVLAGPSVSRADCPEAVPLLTDDEINCQKKIWNAAVDFLRDINVARQNCLLRELNFEFIREEVDCKAPLATGGTGDEVTDDHLRRAEANLTRVVLTNCTGIQLENLGFPSFCIDLTGEPFDAFDLVQCLLSHTRTIDNFHIEVEHPPFPGPLEFNEITCQDGLARRSSTMFWNEADHRGKCLIKQIQRVEPESTQCRAENDPLDPDTGRPGTDTNVVAAHNKVLRAIANSCPTIDFSVLGFPHRCPFPDDSVFPLSELTECMYETHHKELWRFLDIIFPCSTWCGNGFIDPYEECDDRDITWSPGEFCRINCTALMCGDPNDSGLPLNSTDSLFILRTAVGVESCAFQVCDVNSDLTIDATDALLHLQFVVGLDVELVCPVLSLTCGNGFLEELEDCDDGDEEFAFGDYCNSTCFAVDCGDPDDSRFINILDAQYVLHAAVGNATCHMAVCDVTGNGILNSTDALRVLMRSVGLVVAFNCPDPPETPLPPER